MANFLFDAYKRQLLTNAATAGSLLTVNVKAILVDYAVDTPAKATDEFLSDILAGARVATSGNMTTPTITGAGIYNVDDWTWPNVTGAECESVLHYIDSGSEATSTLLSNLDTGITGLPVTPNNQNINFTVDAAGLWGL